MPSDKKIRKLVCTKKGITGKAYLYKGRKKKMKGKMGEVEKKRAKGCHVYNSPFSEFEKLQSTIKFNRYFVTPNRVKHQLVTIRMSASHGYVALVGVRDGCGVPQMCPDIWIPAIMRKSCYIIYFITRSTAGQNYSGQESLVLLASFFNLLTRKAQWSECLSVQHRDRISQQRFRPAQLATHISASFEMFAVGFYPV